MVESCLTAAVDRFVVFSLANLPTPEWRRVIQTVLGAWAVRTDPDKIRFAVRNLVDEYSVFLFSNLHTPEKVVRLYRSNLSECSSSLVELVASDLEHAGFFTLVSSFLPYFESPESDSVVRYYIHHFAFATIPRSTSSAIVQLPKSSEEYYTWWLP